MSTVTRRPVVLAAAVATAAALGTSVLALPALAADGADGAAAAPALQLKDGTLDWGFKESFRKYLASPMAQGKTTVGGGAKQAADHGVFTFVEGAGTYDTGTHATATGFKGSVRFEAHHGVLDITLSDVKLTTRGTAAPTGEILADVVTKAKDGTFVTRNDVAVAALDMTGVRPGQGAGGAMVFKDIPAKLTKGGAEAFAGFYKEGDALDAATLTVKAGGTQPTPTPTPTKTTTPTPAPTPTPTKTTAPPTTAPTTAKPTALPATGTSSVVSGRLTWGVKGTWRSYVVNTCGGKAVTTGGATRNGPVYDFALASGAWKASSRTADAAFKGTVRFECAAHTIDLAISDVKVMAKGSAGTLVADVTTSKGTRNDVTFADLDFTKADYTAKNGVVTLKSVPARLTKDGAAQFAGPNGEAFYKPGTAIDPVTVALTVDKDATLPSTTTGTGGTTGGTAGGSTTGGGGTVGGSGSLAATGADVPAGTLLATAGATALAGAAVVLAARRRTTES
ncbi:MULTISPECIES: HtaA domain-containing protein [unclassified Streptomyces]|uniref:HtaA domain-containing protein n=1 Tax=Streptomyces sp. NPDC127129 TaxID=3345373 RepID=UPI00363EA81D